jgi:hypothetical protein
MSIRTERILKDDALIVALAMTLGFYTIAAYRPFFTALDTPLAASWEKLSKYSVDIDRGSYSSSPSSSFSSICGYEPSLTWRFAAPRRPSPLWQSRRPLVDCHPPFSPNLLSWLNQSTFLMPEHLQLFRVRTTSSARYCANNLLLYAGRPRRRRRSRLCARPQQHQQLRDCVRRNSIPCRPWYELSLKSAPKRRTALRRRDATS